MKNSLTIYFPNTVVAYQNIGCLTHHADDSYSFKTSADTVRFFSEYDLKAPLETGIEITFKAPYLYKDYSSLPEGELPEKTETDQ